MSNKNKAINGAKWTSISTVFGAVLQFVQVAILARLLHPSEFGLVSISTLVINFLSIFAHFGFANSIIHKQESDVRNLSTMYFFNIITGFILLLVIYFGAPLLMLYYKEQQLVSVLRISAFYFPIVFFGQIYNILLEKELKFKWIAITDIICSTVGTTVAIILAYQNYQAKALVIGLLSTQFLKMLILNFLGRKLFSPIFYFKLREIKDHLIFGIYNIGDSLLSFANSNLDTIIIGGLLGVKQLGYYTIAAQIAIYPVARICPIIVQIAYPIMAKFKDNIPQLKSAYLKVLDLMMYCISPLLFGLFMLAGNVIPYIYGKGWEPTIPLVHIFVFMGLFTSMVYPLSTLVYSTGKPKLLFYLNLFTLIIKFPLIYILGTHFGVRGIAYGILASSFFAMLANFYIIKVIAGSFMDELIPNTAKPIFFSLVMAGAILAYKYLLGDTGVVHMIVQIALGGLIYLAFTLKYKFSFQDLKNLRTAIS